MWYEGLRSVSISYSRVWFTQICMIPCFPSWFSLKTYKHLEHVVVYLIFKLCTRSYNYLN